MKKNKIKEIVRKAYANIARKETAGCGCGCGGTDAKALSKLIGYSEKDLKSIPKDANLGLGCGNPIALAGLKPGEVVCDLGSGAGIDCFIAAKKVGPSGKIFGIDMTPEMIKKARSNAKKTGIKNVEFKLGDIEDLPLPDNSVDVVISNCVINLSSDKSKVIKEIYRVLKPGGRVSISDMALRKKLPKAVEKSIAAYTHCISGALMLDDYKKMMASVGLKKIKFTPKNIPFIDKLTEDPVGRAIMDGLLQGKPVYDYVTSIYIDGYK